MRFLKFAVLAPLVLLLGCVHIHESSATATKDQIQARLKAQLHCQFLELHERGSHGYLGTGKNDTGEFTIEVNREAEVIKFHGVYTPPSQGTFSGSASWSKKVNAGFGVHRAFESDKTSLGTP